MTVNKSQGPSLALVEVDLSAPYFSHSQPYVALFRVTDVSWLASPFKENGLEKTENVASPEVLLPTWTDRVTIDILDATR